MRSFGAMACLLAGVLIAAPLALAQNAQRIDAAKLRAPYARMQAQSAATTTAAPADQPQPTSAVVPANAEWAPTGVSVQNGGRLQISASDGRWSIGPRSQRYAAANVDQAATNADGFNERTSPQAMAPNANIGALIGKIGENGTPFLVGMKYDATAAADGPLFLAINDQPGAYGDNQGRMPVSIIVTAPPPQQTTDTGGTQTGAPTTIETTTTADNGVPVAPTDQTPGASPDSAKPTTPAALPDWAVPAGIGALLIAAILLWPRPKPPLRNRQARRNTPRTGVTTRIVSDGRGGQQLSVRWRDRK